MKMHNQHLSMRSISFPHFIMIYTVKDFGIVSETEVDVFLEFPFSVIQWMLAIWSLVPFLFLNWPWTSGRSWFTYCWSLACKILSMTLLAWGIVQLPNGQHNLWYYPSWEWDEYWPFPVLWPLLGLPICWHIEGNTLTASSFRVLSSWNSVLEFCHIH